MDPKLAEPELESQQIAKPSFLSSDFFREGLAQE